MRQNASSNGTTGAQHTGTPSGPVGYTGPNSNVSLAGTVALFVAVNVLLLAAMYPVFAAVAMLGLMSGYAVARYRGRTTRLQSDSETRPPQATPRPR